MKQIVLIALIALGTLNLNAKGITAPDYVSTNFGTFFYENVREGFGNYLIIRNEAGETMKFDKELVKSYKSNGHVYERKPVIINGKASSETTFMELMCYRNGVHVYRDKNTGNAGNQVYSVHLFKGNDFIMSINENNKDYIVEFLQNK
jgi:hypothetical protein